MFIPTGNFITEENKKVYKSIILINALTQSERRFKIVSDLEDRLLEPLFIELLSKGYIAIDGMYYAATEKGIQALDVFMQRYDEYLRFYDVFSLIDLTAAEFAFKRYFDFDSDESWNQFKTDPRFEDLRIAVAMFKDINPAEIVFMSFINENRFSFTTTGWQMDMISDAIWNEIELICSTALKPTQLGDEAMVDIISQGSKIVVNLIKEEQLRNQQIAEAQLQEAQNIAAYTTSEVYEEVVEETTTTYYNDPVYYESFYDPYYISPIWFVPLLLL